MSESTRSKTPSIPQAVSDYLAQIGKKGGSSRGAAKSRGDREYYAKLSAMRKEKRGRARKREG